MDDKDRIARDKVVQAYISSNIYWPQSRASFVLVLLADVNSSEAKEICNWKDMRPDLWDLDRIVSAADRMHIRNNINTVLPTRRDSVVREIKQSCKVFERTLRELKIFDAGKNEDLAKFSIAASAIWNWMKTSELSNRHIELISGPESSMLSAIPLPPEKNIVQIEFLKSIAEKFTSETEHLLIDALMPEIVHKITIIRIGDYSM
jgi:hypothetical protein